jgi:hypothetical protein
VAGAVESYAELAVRILGRPARLGRTRLVAVDGPSGAGKTTFAARLAAALATVGGPASAAGVGGGAGVATGPVPAVPDPVPVVHTDDLLDGWADQFTFWPRLDEWVLAPLRAGRPGRYRRYDWRAGHFAGPWITVPPAPVVILEGVSSARAAVAAELTFAVFVTAPVRLRRDRALSRDGVELLPWLRRWWRGERRHFATDRTAARADLVVDGATSPSHDAAGRFRRLR